MSLLSVYCILSLGILNVLTNAAVVKNNRPKGRQLYTIWLFYCFFFSWFTLFICRRFLDLALVTTKAPVSKLLTEKPTPKLVSRERKLTRRERCCNLGRKVAKIGETCTYSPDVDHIYPNSHYHQMKTAVWTRRSHPINRRLLPKCKPFKAFYEKCCHYEFSLITEDLLRAKRKINQYLKDIRKHEAGVEREGSADEVGGLPEAQDQGINKKQLVNSQ